MPSIRSIVWMRVLTTSVVIAAAIIIRDYVSGIGPWLYATFAVILSTVLLHALEDFIPHVCNLRWLRRRLAAPEFIEGWWVGEVATAHGHSHYQVEEIVRELDGRFRISGTCFVKHGNEHTECGQYHSKTASLTSDLTLVFSYEWLFQDKEPSYGLCTRNISATHDVPAAQSGYFIDKNEALTYLVRVVRAPSGLSQNAVSFGEKRKILAWYAETETYFGSGESHSGTRSVNGTWIYSVIPIVGHFNSPSEDTSSEARRRIFLGRLRISIESDGAIGISGQNFDDVGALTGHFQSEAASLNWPCIRYLYSWNRMDGAAASTFGWGELLFEERDGPPHSFSGVFEDFDARTRFKFHAFRVPEDLESYAVSHQLLKDVRGRHSKQGEKSASPVISLSEPDSSRSFQ